MRTSTLLLALVLGIGGVAAQESPDGLAKAKPRAPKEVDLKSPVTQAEAKAALDRAAKVLRPVFQAKAPSSALPSSPRPVTRAEVVGEFHRVFEACRPQFKFTPAKTAFDRSRLTLKDSKAKGQLETLIAFGAVARIGPVAAGSKDTLTVVQFGDALGFLVTRMAELTHLPSSKWSPNLKP